jgi:autoinducer 2-degrading protein
MYVTLVHAHVVAQHVDDFIAASRANHLAAVHEPGNLRFDILQLADDPTRFILYEAYETAEFARAHKDTPHYATWRDRVAPWMAEPRQGVVCNGLLP